MNIFGGSNPSESEDGSSSLTALRQQPGKARANKALTRMGIPSGQRSRRLPEGPPSDPPPLQQRIREAFIFHSRRRSSATSPASPRRPFFESSREGIPSSATITYSLSASSGTGSSAPVSVRLVSFPFSKIRQISFLSSPERASYSREVCQPPEEEGANRKPMPLFKGSIEDICKKRWEMEFAKPEISRQNDPPQISFPVSEFRIPDTGMYAGYFVSLRGA